MHMASKDGFGFVECEYSGSIRVNCVHADTCFVTAGLCDCGEDVEAGFLFARVCRAPTGFGV